MTRVGQHLSRYRTRVGTIIEKISGNMGVEILNDGGSMAFYRPSEDKIHLPEKSAFYNDYEYNATALHELSHATGAESRLNRSLGHAFGTGQYAYEELVAEISACFMGEHLSVELSSQHMDNHKAYVQSWIKDISEKPSVLVQAIRDAEQAANYLENQAELITEKEYLETLQDNKVVVNGDSPTAEEIVGEIKKAGFRPTEELVENMVKLNELTGQKHSLKDVVTLYKGEQFQIGKEASEAVLHIAMECKAQELDRMIQQAAPAV